MINLIQNIRNLAIFSVILLLIGAGSWEIIRRHISPAPKEAVIIPDVKPQTHNVIIQPKSPNEYVTAFNSVIKIKNTLVGQDLTTVASDGYKNTTAYDKLIFPILYPKWSLQADFYFGIINQKPVTMYGGSGSYNFTERFFAGGGIAGSSDGAMVHVHAGMLFF
jgi:hypothetical protein